MDQCIKVRSTATRYHIVTPCVAQLGVNSVKDTLTSVVSMPGRPHAQMPTAAGKMPTTAQTMSTLIKITVRSLLKPKHGKLHLTQN